MGPDQNLAQLKRMKDELAKSGVSPQHSEALPTVNPKSPQSPGYHPNGNQSLHINGGSNKLSQVDSVVDFAPSPNFKIGSKHAGSSPKLNLNTTLDRPFDPNQVNSPGNNKVNMNPIVNPMSYVTQNPYILK